MITVSAVVRVHLALGPTKMRKDFDGFVLQVQDILGADSFSGDLLILRGKRAGTVKILLHDGNGESFEAGTTVHLRMPLNGSRCLAGRTPRRSGA